MMEVLVKGKPTGLEQIEAFMFNFTRWRFAGVKCVEHNDNTDSVHTDSSKYTFQRYLIGFV